MNSWQINIPFRDRGDSLAELADAIRETIDEPQEREVTRRLVLDAAADGARSAGELIDRIERADPTERRAMLDRARERAGLPTTGRVDAEPTHHPASEGPRLQTCHAEGCVSYPGYPAGAEMSAARRWFCPAHEHLAAPGDAEPVEPAYHLDIRTMSLRPGREERERIEAEERRRKEKLREELERREREAEAVERARERYDEQAVEDVAGIRVHP